MGYQPSLAGRALVMAGKKLKIGVILQSSETPFMQQVLQGIQAAKQEVEALGVTVDIHEVEGVNAGAVIALTSQVTGEGRNRHDLCLFPPPWSPFLNRKQIFVKDYYFLYFA